MTSAFLKKKKKLGFSVCTKLDKAGIFKLTHPEERSLKSAVSVCAVSVKTPAWSKRKADPYKYLYVFTETRRCVNGA